MDGTLVSIIVLCYFSSTLTENVGINSNLPESFHLRSFLGMKAHKRDEEEHSPHYQHVDIPHSGHFFSGIPSDHQILQQISSLTADAFLHALQSALTRTTTSTTTTTTTKAPSTTTKAPSTTTKAPSTTTKAPSTTTQPPTTTTAPFTFPAVSKADCKDQVSNCETYGPQICKKYTTWAKVQCEKYCVFCFPMSTTTTAPPSSTTVKKIQWLHIIGR